MNLPAHGGNLADIARRHRVDEASLIDFSASINPLGPPEVVKEILAEAAPLLLHYPDPDCAELTAALSQRHACEPSQIVAGNGSNELIYLLCRVLKPARAVIVEPTFSEYARALEQVGCEIDRVFAREDKAFQHPLDEALAGARNADVLFLCNPNNPTAALAWAKDVLELAESAPKCLVVVDEAFMDFAEEAPIFSCVGKGNVLVLRSMTKFYAIPGLRLGYAVGPEEIVQRLRAARDPWSVNALAQTVGVAVLSDAEYVERTHYIVERERKHLADRLMETGRLLPYPSFANFVMVRIVDPKITCDALRAALIPKGIVIRHCSNFPGLGPQYFRVAVRMRNENEALLRALGEALREI